MAVRSYSRLRKVLVLATWAILLSLALWILMGYPTESIRFQILPNTLSVPAQLDTATATITEHPIKTLVRRAETDFDKLLARQSTSFEMAVSEYVRRYKRPPPPGFEIWYDYATRNDSPIIDEFDIINESLAPFWSLSGAELKRRLEKVHGPSISHCRPSGPRDPAECEALWGEVLQLLGEAGILRHLPEMNILINKLDEPRVIGEGDNSLEYDSDNEQLSDWTDLSHKHNWDKITTGCHHNDEPNVTEAVSPMRKPEITGFELYTNKSDKLDLCRHPEYSSMHGL